MNHARVYKESIALVRFAPMEMKAKHAMEMGRADPMSFVLLIPHQYWTWTLDSKWSKFIAFFHRVDEEIERETLEKLQIEPSECE